MNFDLNDATFERDIQNEDNFSLIASARSTSGSSALRQSPGENSLILKELFEEIDQLRGKIKLNQRQLLFLESENHRLLQEKNKYFFDSKNTNEKLNIIVEKNDSLSQTYDILESKYELLVIFPQ